MAKKKYIEVGKTYPLRHAAHFSQVRVEGIARKGRGHTVTYIYVRGTGLRNARSLTDFCAMIDL